MAKSATYPNSEKFNGDKTKLKAFLAQLNLKLQRNIDRSIRKSQNTEQNKLSYAILCLEGDAFAQIEPHFLAENIDFENINQFVEVLKTCFGEVNPVGTAKHDLYRLYRTNKVLEVFLNTFLQLFKKAKIDDSQVLDMLYEKLSDKFKDRLVTVRKAEHLNDLILLLRDINVNMKKISKQSQLYVKPNTSNFPATKPPFKSYNSPLPSPSLLSE